MSAGTRGGETGWAWDADVEVGFSAGDNVANRRGVGQAVGRKTDNKRTPLLQILRGRWNKDFSSSSSVGFYNPSE